jgi:hypothetical protein
MQIALVGRGKAFLLDSFEVAMVLLVGMLRPYVWNKIDTLMRHKEPD